MEIVFSDFKQKGRPKAAHVKFLRSLAGSFSRWLDPYSAWYAEMAAMFTMSRTSEL